MNHPNIVWITLESVRFDHTSLSSYERNTTPNLARLAAKDRSTSFSQCFCPAIWTVPSTASMLTGTYLSSHGVGGVAKYLDDSFKTVPALLSAQGYETGICMQNPIIGMSRNLDRDFDHSTAISKVDLWGERRFGTLLKYLRRYREHTTGLNTNGTEFNASYITNEVAKQQLKKLGTSEPFFQYIHYGDSHHPYTPPLPYLEAFTDNIEMGPREALECAVWMRDNLDEIIANGCDLSKEQWNAILAMYDATLLYTDAQLAKLIEYIRGLDIGETILVVTADHGDLFGEQGLLSHRLVVDDALSHVPLIVHGMNGLEGIEDNLVQQIDLMQTLLSDVGSDTEQFQGVDVRTTNREYVVTERSRENFGAHANQIFEHNRGFDISRFPPNFLTALRTKEFKYTQSKNRESLYRLPNEELDVKTTYPEMTRNLRTKLRAWRNSVPDEGETAREINLSSSEREQLEQLGYL